MTSDIENYRPGVTLEVGRAEADAAFQRAIGDGRLSADPRAENYAGRFMFMGRKRDGRDAFKHSSTREYLP